MRFYVKNALVERWFLNDLENLFSSDFLNIDLEIEIAISIYIEIEIMSVTFHLHTSRDYHLIRLLF